MMATSRCLFNVLYLVEFGKFHSHNYHKIRNPFFNKIVNFSASEGDSGGEGWIWWAGGRGRRPSWYAKLAGGTP